MTFAAAAMSASAQQMDPLPLDPAVRYGKLDNGMTYYIRHNNLPKGQAEFHIAQKVGSVLEEENQRGLAHFLEHMAFNGTTNFPGDNLLKYMESIGVKFGYNINAGTGFDKTVYMLSKVPVSREGIVDSCLLVLHDWASEISLEDAEIDKERGVIHEEWRTSTDAAMRMYNTLVPVMFEGSQYANRMPIGTMEVVDNFPYQTIKDYYEKWYRPDLQGIVIVGDIDVDQIEAKVKKLFGPITMPENAAERVYFPVPDNKEPIVVIGTDKELPMANIMVFYKHDVLPKEVKASAAGLVMDYMNSVISAMYNNRMAELTQKANPPFLMAQGADEEFFIAKTKDAFNAIAVCPADAINMALTALIRETERVNKHGFTASEYERAKANYMKRVDNMYNERDKNNNEYYVDQYISNFIDGTTAAGIETEYAMINQIAPAITIDQINQYAKKLVTEDNVVIAVMAPEKEGVTYPTKDELLATYNTVKAEPVEAYVDAVSNEPLMATLPTAGKVVKTVENPTFEATEWVLSNGAKVIVKSTKYKDDEVRFKGTSVGGSSLVADADIPNIKSFSEVSDLGGVGAFNKIDLLKILSGKKLSFGMSLDEKSEAISGSASAKDLETLMQLIYLKFTAPHKDVEAFESWKGRTSAMYGNLTANPMYVFADSLTMAMYNNPRHSLTHKEDIDAVDYDRVLDIYADRYGDASDFVFTFVGNIDPETFKPMVEQYIASLPATNRGEKSKDLGINLRKGKIQNFFDKEMETPKTTLALIFSAKMKGTLENMVKLDMLKQILWSSYLKTMREDEGGTYSPRATSEFDIEEGEGVIFVQLDTNAEQRDKMMSIATAEFEKIAENGPSAEDLNKVKEYTIKTQAEQLQDNAFWLSKVDNYYYYGIDELSGFDDIVKSQTAQSISEFAKEMLKQGNVIEISMDGVAKK